MKLLASLLGAGKAAAFERRAAAAPAHRPSSRRAPCFDAIEPRVLMSADVAPAVVPMMEAPALVASGGVTVVPGAIVQMVMAMGADGADPPPGQVLPNEGQGSQAATGGGAVVVFEPGHEPGATRPTVDGEERQKLIDHVWEHGRNQAEIDAATKDLLELYRRIDEAVKNTPTDDLGGACHTFGSALFEQLTDPTWGRLRNGVDPTPYFDYQREYFLRIPPILSVVDHEWYRFVLQLPGTPDLVFYIDAGTHLNGDGMGNVGGDDQIYIGPVPKELKQTNGLPNTDNVGFLERLFNSALGNPPIWGEDPPEHGTLPRGPKF